MQETNNYTHPTSDDSVRNHSLLSRKNLSYLSRELAQNYFNSSLPKNHSNTENDEKIKSAIFIDEKIEGNNLKRIASIISPSFRYVPDEPQQKNSNENSINLDNIIIQPKTVYNPFSDKQEEQRQFVEIGKKKSWARNILVLGAGCTNDSFSHIPMGNAAISKLYQKLNFGEYLDGDGKPEKVTLETLISTWDNSKGTLREDSCEKLKAFIDNNNAIKGILTRYHSELNKLKLYHPEGLNSISNNDFETRLFLLSQFYPVSEIREEIKNLYNHQFGPTLFYELIAHMFKHRMIDIIVNFNFDELLDQAISDELGDGNYHKIVSDGDCKQFTEFLIDNKLKQPIYIKPHGTASHKSTLRFTKDQYFDLPKDINKLLSEMMSEKPYEEEVDSAGNNHNGAVRSSSSTDSLRSEKVNLIIIGFDMASVEFNNILANKLSKDSKIFYFQYFDKLDDKNIVTQIQRLKNKFYGIFKTKMEAPKAEDRQGNYTENPLDGGEEVDRGEEVDGGEEDILPKLYPISFQLFVDPTSNTPALGQAFNLLFKEISNLYERKFKPSNTSRHILLNKLFGERDFVKSLFFDGTDCHKSYFGTYKYLLDRCIIEILIAIFRSKGVIDPEDILTNKAGRYYSLYERKLNNGTPTTFANILKVIKAATTTNANIEVNSINVFEPIKFYLPNSDEENGYAEYFFKIIKACHKGGIISEPFYNSFLNSYADNSKESINNCLQGIYQSNLSNIKANFTEPSYHIFKKFSGEDILHTPLAVDYFYEKVIQVDSEQSGLDTLLMIAENGYFFKKYREDIIKRYDKIVIILANYHSELPYDESRALYAKQLLNGKSAQDTEKEYKKLNEGGKIFKVLLLQPLSHNHHMSIFTSSTNKTLYGKGIYYYQDGYSNIANPIGIEEPENILSLVKRFEDYCNRVRSAVDKQQDTLENSDIDFREIEDLVTELKVKQITIVD